ncbi:MAG: hypothetical protein IKZ82_13480 [Clostridia bacterium]|nr:hypothetical protein [Clostridia bacterium]
MKKLDLHIHTLQTFSDAPFAFSLERLKEYVKALKIDGIAITNHNKFDLPQYNEIRDILKDTCVVLPGIEINVGKNSAGHLICITEQDDIEDFAIRCSKIQDRITATTDFISLNELKSFFPILEKYLWIPHYDKKPALDSDIISGMGSNILCGEVSSVKKFIYGQKDTSSLTPLYFSDLRPDDKPGEFDSRQTYFNIDEITVASIRKSLLNKRNVSLTEKEGVDEFYVMPDLPISTGLTVVMGERSSGKTFLLDQISNGYPNAKYIKQFSLVETKPEQAAKDFTDQISAKSSSFAEKYFGPLKEAVETVKEISIDEDARTLERYVDSLVRCAKETDRKDSFAKCALYNESIFPSRRLDGLEKLIESVETLLNVHENKDIVEKHLSRDALIALLKDLILKYNQEKRRSLEETWVNDLIGEVKRSLSTRTSATTIADIDFYELQMNRVKVNKFNILIGDAKKRAIINSRRLGGFSVQAEKSAFTCAAELKKFSKQKNVAFSDYMDKYTTDPYRFLLGLKEMDGIPESDYYKYFVHINYQILNQYGYPISGGERAEFKLLQEIDTAHGFDMLLIDEPESSFDNIFLRDRVNSIIRELSSIMPVILVTHNNTVGASIKPDYLVYTKRHINHQSVLYERYYGLPSSKHLVSASGSSIENFQAVLDCLEAGEKTYNERKHGYELLKD